MNSKQKGMEWIDSNAIMAIRKLGFDRNMYFCVKLTHEVEVMIIKEQRLKLPLGSLDMDIVTRSFQHASHVTASLYSLLIHRRKLTLVVTAVKKRAVYGPYEDKVWAV